MSRSLYADLSFAEFPVPQVASPPAGMREGLDMNWAQWRQASPKRSQNNLEERFINDASAGASGVPHPALRRGLLLFSRQAVTLHALTLPPR